MHTLHRYVGIGDSAFIMTPNFAMDTNHVPQRTTRSSRSKRLTLQHFVTVSSSLVRRLAQNNQDARPFANWSTWPPPVILDVLYGNAAMKRWATQTTIDLIDKWTKDKYYKQQNMEQENAQATAAHTTKQVAERLQRAKERAKRRGGQEKMDMLDVILYLSQLSGPRYFSEPTSPSESSQPSPEDVSREKVEQWLRSNPSM